MTKKSATKIMVLEDEAVNFHKIFDPAYQPTSREPKLGHYSMMVGIMLKVMKKNESSLISTNEISIEILFSYN
jgi:hypothetical protein